jgi:hypothetical protein
MEASRAMSPPESLTLLLTVSETADLLRTTRKAVYVMIERGLLPASRASVAACSYAAPTC